MKELEISKMRPQVVKQECERLYDDVLRQRMATNSLIDENTKLRTRLQFVEELLKRKDACIDDLYLQ